MEAVNARIDRLLSGPPYGVPAGGRFPLLRDLLRDQVVLAAEADTGYRNYVRHWPVAPAAAATVADLPYLPVRMFKRDPPPRLVPAEHITRLVTSSATTGQAPSRIALDAATARRMSRSMAAIIRDFIGPERRPYLVIDEPAAQASGYSLGARGAAIRGLTPFATETVYGLNGDGSGELTLDRDRLLCFADAHRDRPVLVYGFTYILWTRLVQPLLAEGINLGMTSVHVLHSGGWKRLLDQAVSKDVFNDRVARVFGCDRDRIIDFYGLVENVGIIYPDCREGNKHAPAFGEVIVRDPLTLKPVASGGTGLVQVCSVLPSSFPGHLLLTEDLATVVSYEGCPCGRPGSAFRFAGRVPKAELRGCGDVAARPFGERSADHPRNADGD